MSVISDFRFKRQRGTHSGQCAICGDFTANLHGDHCHSTGLGRGLLCRGCNFGLGNFKDSPDRLLFAAAYLNHYRIEHGISDREAMVRFEMHQNIQRGRAEMPPVKRSA